MNGVWQPPMFQPCTGTTLFGQPNFGMGMNNPYGSYGTLGGTGTMGMGTMGSYGTTGTGQYGTPNGLTGMNGQYGGLMNNGLSG